MSLIKRQRTDNGEHQSLIRSEGSGARGKVLYNIAVLLEGHQGPVLSARFNHRGSKIASCGMDKSILLWNLPVDESDESPNYGELKGHKSAVTSLSWLYDDVTIFSGSADNTIGYWDAETGRRVRKGVGHEAVINAVDISTDSIGASVSDDGRGFLWDQRDKNPTGTVKTEYPLLACKFNNQGSTLFMSGIEPTLCAYDIRALEKPIWECPGQYEAITSIAVNSDDSIVLTRSMDGIIKTYSAKEFVPEGISRLAPNSYEGAPSGKEFQLIKACFSNDNVSIYSGSEDKTVTSWEFSSRKMINKYQGHRGTVLDVDYHPTERIIISSSTDGSIIAREV